MNLVADLMFCRCHVSLRTSSPKDTKPLSGTGDRVILLNNSIFPFFNCPFPKEFKHCKSAKLPFHHNVKLSFWSLPFCLFVQTSL